MLTISREDLAQALCGFRLLKRKKGGPSEPLHISAHCAQHTLRLSAVRLNHTLVHRSPAPQTAAGIEPFIVPLPALEAAVKAADKGSTITLEPGLLRYPVQGVAVAAAVDSPAPPAPLPRDEPASETLLLKSEVMERILEASACASTDEARAILNGVHLGPERIAATDGRRLYAAKAGPLPLPEEGIILPLHGLLKLFACAGEVCLRLGPVPPGEELSRAFQLVAGPWIWGGLLVHGRYPNYRQVIPRESEARQTVEISHYDAMRVLEILPKLPGSKEKDAPVLLELGEGQASLVAGPGGNSTEVLLAESPVSGDGKPERVTFNRDFLLEALRQGFRLLAVKDSLSTIAMEDPEQSRIHLWMPLRTEPAEPARAADTAALPAAGPSGPGETAPSEHHTHPTNRLMSKPKDPTPPASVAPEKHSSLQNGHSPGNGTHGPDPEGDPVARAVEGLGRLRDLLRELQGAVQEVNVALRDAGREHRALAKEHRSLRRNLRGLKTLDV